MYTDGIFEIILYPVSPSIHPWVSQALYQVIVWRIVVLGRVIKYG